MRIHPVRKHLIITFLLSFVFVPGSSGQTGELPIRKVVLYKHGVGFFERSASVPAGEPVRLEFKATEMDDVLKSLTVTTDGAAVSEVRYESSDPLSKKLAKFPFRIGEAQPLSRILDQFKGARILLRMAKDEIAGTIISARTIAATDSRSERHQVLLLTDEGEMRTVDPDAALGLRFADRKLQEQFREYLTLIAGSRNREKRTVLIRTSGEAGRVSARYVVPTPVWKSSYRLIFGEQAQPMLEGWAIVDNTSGDDWESVGLSLVSGMPVSFISRLYEPTYRLRPVAELARNRAQRPIVHRGVVGGVPGGTTGGVLGGLIGGVLASEEQERRMAGGRLRADQGKMESRNRSIGLARKAMAQAPASMIAAEASADFAANEPMLAAPSRLAQTASAGALGDLFAYRIGRPVTIRKGESAMLPFLQQKVKARKLLIFNEANGSQHPLNAVELTNDTGKTLDGGVVTVLDDGAYAGEALFETIKEDDKRLVSYAVDLGMRITTAFKTSSKMLSEFTLRRGILTTRHASKETRTFTIRNVDQQTKTVIIERPARPGYKPVGEEPSEKTADRYRYEVEVPPGETVEFPVTEERVTSQSIGVTNLTYDRLVAYTRNKTLNAESRAKLEQIAGVKRSLADANREIQMLEKSIQELFQDQERLRRNISSLRSVSGQQQQVQTYALTLSRQEGELAKMRDRQAALRQQQSNLQTELNTLIETLVI